MTREEFIAALRRTQRTWNPKFADRAIRLTAIKHGVGCYACPITAVCADIVGVFFFSSQVFSAGEALGMSEELVQKIVDAADEFSVRSACYQPELRNEMIEALGLLGL